LIGRNSANLIVGWSGQFLFFVVPRQFSQDISEWPENQILIPDWPYFHCPDTTLTTEGGYSYSLLAHHEQKEADGGGSREAIRADLAWRNRC